MKNSSKEHMKATKRILRYVKSTIDFGIHYSSNMFELVGFTNSNLKGSLGDRKSISGNYFSLGSGLITSNSKKKSMVSLSSIEEKYVVVTSG